ncbi:phage holin family protein [Pseudomonas helmanticensis]|uniref:phage holin family protein n=1 Tax=Pseudomonas helmanticensis TaxID=1471381 RepID=UPI003820045F
MDSQLMPQVLTQATFWLCVTLFVRLFTFRRRGARFRRSMSCLAWVVMVASGSAVVYIGKGQLVMPQNSWPLVVVLMVFVGSVCQSNGNLARVWKMG